MAEHRERDEELERYRQAANDALEQLDWCIGYLHGIRKTAIAGVLARNRQFIRQHLLHVATEPTPTGANVKET